MSSNKNLKAFRAVSPWMALLAVIAPVTQAQDEDGPSVSVSAAYTGDVRRNTTGGLEVGTAYSDAIDLGLVWVNDGLFANARMTTNLSVMYLGGGDISGEYLGDLQGVNNLEAATAGSCTSPGWSSASATAATRCAPACSI